MANEERTLEIRSGGMARGQKVLVQDVPMNKIKLGRNSRLSVSKEDLSGLMQSINSTGLLEPIGLIKSKDGRSFQIAYGNRRFMAFSKLGLHSIPAVIHEYKNENDVDVKNLAENVQRRNISLAEVGRYATILEGEGLGKKELAVRLGVPLNYLESCLAAYRDVPEEYRDDLQMQTSGKKAEHGKISIQAARAIINVKKAYNLNKKDASTLFEAAKSDERFNPDSVSQYAAAIRKGSKDPVGTNRAVKTVTFRFMLPVSQYDSLMQKYVESGPFGSFAALVKAVLRGQKQVSINFID